jgi:hypothetical protein
VPNKVAISAIGAFSRRIDANATQGGEVGTSAQNSRPYASSGSRVKMLMSKIAIARQGCARFDRACSVLGNSSGQSSIRRHPEMSRPSERSNKKTLPPPSPG